MPDDDEAEDPEGARTGLVERPPGVPVVTHELRCACLVCGLRRDLSPAVRCRECGVWFRCEDVPGAEAVIRCEECSSLNGGKR